MALGDHLFYYRAGTAYSHHGIDCGDGSVVHFESSIWQKLASMSQLERAVRPPRVVVAGWDEFALGAEVYIRDYQQADPADLVLCRARSRLGQTNYDLWGNNCEHFAVWCKTGVAHSTQVAALQEANRALLQFGPTSMLMMRAARYLPPQFRGLAYTGAAAVAGTACVTTYLRHRSQHQRLRMS